MGFYLDLLAIFVEGELVVFERSGWLIFYNCYC